MKLKIIILSVVIILSGVFIVLYTSKESLQNKVFSKKPSEIRISQIATTTDGKKIVSSSQSYAYLFEGKREAMTSNIVGYFGGGAFAWYVPDWLVTNWKMLSLGSEDMQFAPLVRENPTDFGNITFKVSTSTEIYNAENLYQMELRSSMQSGLVLNEVLLNKFANNATVDLLIDTNTRIYHITNTSRNGEYMVDTYYMDGNGKTLIITFDAKSGIFSQFTDKIRDMVEGIGELQSPRG